MAVALPQGKQQFFTDAGAFLAGGKVYAYIAGTSTPKDTYTTAAQTIANTNPVILNSRGEAAIYWAGAYDVILKTAADVTIYGPERVEQFATDADFDAFVASLANTSNVAQGDALFGVKSTLSGAVATTQHEVNDRTRSVFDWLTTAEKAAVPAGTVLDITTNLQAAIDSGESLIWPRGSYYVKKLTFTGIGKTYYFNGAQIFAIDTAAQTGLIDWKASYCTIYNMALFGQWKSNYTSALYWHSASSVLPAQSNRFFGLSIDNSLIGILYGEVSPTVAVDAPQSENFIYGFRSRGTERPVYCNQANGFLHIDGEITSAKNEWDINNPGVYSYTQACPITVLLGVVRATGEIIKADTQLGLGLRNSGGTLEVSGVMEIACQVFAGSGSIGSTNFHDVTFGYWANASVSWAALSGTGGTLSINNLLLNKALAAASANTAFIELGTATGWDVSLTDCRLENQLHTVFSNGSSQADMWSGDNRISFQNVTGPAVGGGTAPLYPRVSTVVSNLLDLRGTDTIGNDIATWYKRDVTGVGAIALNADIPTSSNYFNSVMVTPAVTTGRSGVYSADLTSLTTVKATAIKCRPGETYMMSGYFRMTTAGTANVSLLFINTAGTAQVVVDAITQATLLTSAWRYLTVMFTVPALSAYFGVGIEGVSGTVCRLAGPKVARLGNEP